MVAILAGLLLGHEFTGSPVRADAPGTAETSAHSTAPGGGNTNHVNVWEPPRGAGTGEARGESDTEIELDLGPPTPRASPLMLTLVPVIAFLVLSALIVYLFFEKK